jgi:hypothetical protein
MSMILFDLAAGPAYYIVGLKVWIAHDVAINYLLVRAALGAYVCI